MIHGRCFSSGWFLMVDTFLGGRGLIGDFFMRPEGVPDLVRDCFLGSFSPKFGREK